MIRSIKCAHTLKAFLSRATVSLIRSKRVVMSRPLVEIRTIYQDWYHLDQTNEKINAAPHFREFCWFERIELKNPYLQEFVIKLETPGCSGSKAL